MENQESNDPLNLSEVEDSEEEESEEEYEDSDEPTQEDLDWVKDLPEDLKGSSSLAKFKTLEDLARSYISLEQKSGKFSGLLQKDVEDVETQKTLFKKAFGEQKYDENIPESFAKSAKEVNLPSKLTSAMYEKYSKEYKKEEEVSKKDAIFKQQQTLKNRPSIQDDNRFFSKALDIAGITGSEYKNIFGEKAYDEKVFEQFVKIGKASMSDAHIEISRGGHGGLPSDPAVLEKRLIELSSKAVLEENPSEKRIMLEELGKIKTKLGKINSNAKNINSVL